MNITSKIQNKENIILNSNLELYVIPSVPCHYHRLILPFSYLNIAPKVPTYIFNRSPDPHKNLRAMKQQGYRIICDVDDYWYLGEDHYDYSAYKRGGTSRKMMEIITLADIVTVTTSELADKVKALNKNVVVIPNALPFDEGQFTLSTNKDAGRFFIWAGGVTHKRDLGLLEGLYSNLEIAGFSAGSAEWRAIKEMASDAVFFPKQTNTNYMSVYNGHRAALAPLTETIFNACKSNLKILEAGAKGIPIITSAVKPYLNETDRNAVFYASNSSEWSEHMRWLMDNPSLAEDAGDALAEHVRTHYRLSDANEIRRQVIDSFS